MAINEIKLINEIEIAQDKICANIDKCGLERFDPRDLDVIYSRFKLKNRAVFLGLKLIDSFFPIKIREIYNISKSCFPTTYYFLAESCMFADKSGRGLKMKRNAQTLIREMLDKYYAGNGLWNYKENTKFYVIKTDHTASMPLYGLARCNTLLLKSAQYYDVPEFEHIANISLGKMVSQHQIDKYADGSWYASYYYNSNDCTLNVNAELLEWISRSDWNIIPSSVEKLFHGIIRLMVNQQNSDGSWPYFSREHMAQHHLEPSVDCHHTGSVIANLIHVLDSGKCTTEESELISQVIIKGLHYYAIYFFDSESGRGITEIGKRRKASTVQYSEALNAFTSAIESEQLNLRVDCEPYRKVADKITEQLLKLIKPDGSAPGDSIIFPVNMNSINWGNGAALWALTHFKTLISNPK